MKPPSTTLTSSGLPPGSPFAPLPPEQILYEDAAVVAFYDRYPVSPGHALIVAKQVTASLFDLPAATQAALWQAVAAVRDILWRKHQPAGFNIGINDGAAAGQTVPHAHVHIIPRYPDDQPDPRGGIRWIFPDQAKYWE